MHHRFILFLAVVQQLTHPTPPHKTNLLRFFSCCCCCWVYFFVIDDYNRRLTVGTRYQVELVPGTCTCTPPKKRHTPSVPLYIIKMCLYILLYLYHTFHILKSTYIVYYNRLRRENKEEQQNKKTTTTTNKKKQTYTNYYKFRFY